MGRVELLRSLGHSYRDLEESGLLLVVVDISCKYFLPASYDDVLRLLTEVAAVGGVRIEHHYEVRRGEELLAQGRSVIACINRQGKPTRLPDYLKVV
jgi:acyl-CoA thioester hydrolase